MTCAYAVRGALKKFPGVDSVDVSLNQGLATVKFKPDNRIRPEELWEAVRKNGFTPKETRILVRGTVAEGKLVVSGTGQTFLLSPSAKAPTALVEVKQQSGKAVTVEGTLTPSKDRAAQIPLQVEKLKEKGQ